MDKEDNGDDLIADLLRISQMAGGWMYCSDLDLYKEFIDMSKAEVKYRLGMVRDGHSLAYEKVFRYRLKLKDSEWEKIKILASLTK
jgi:hypothetical protein